MAPLYIPKILADVMLASTQNKTTLQFGYTHMCQKHRKPFDMEHVQACSEIEGCEDIKRYALKLKTENNIRLWPHEDIHRAVG